MSLTSFLGSILLGLLLLSSLSSATRKLFYDFKVKDAEGEMFDLSKLKGAISLVVNVASQCGYTDSHYKALTELEEFFGNDGKFQVLAFPCNQFGKQEPGSMSEIMKFVQDNYHVNFKVFSKIDVTGANADPAFANLIEQSQAPTWNFWKYLVNEKGEVINAWGPHYSVEAVTDDVMKAIDKLHEPDQTTSNNKGAEAGEL